MCKVSTEKAIKILMIWKILNQHVNIVTVSVFACLHWPSALSTLLKYMQSRYHDWGLVLHVTYYLHYVVLLLLLKWRIRTLLPSLVFRVFAITCLRISLLILCSNIDQCCSQDHLKRDQVKTKTSAGPHRVTHNKMRNLQTTGTPKIDVKEP